MMLMVVLTVGRASPAWCEAVVELQPLAVAHAHNDYYHRRPLLDALDRGFTSVEADVFPVEDSLLVGHFTIELQPHRTLEKLYLEPLAKRVAAHGGRIFRGGPALTLLVDIKRQGPQAFALLQPLLHKYREIVSSTEDGQFTERAITVIVSGDRPIKEMRAANPRYTGMDGRLSDLESDLPADFLPLISDHWGSHFQYTGRGEMPADQRKKLHDLVAQAHARGRRIRFWATPDNPQLWKELCDAGVDLIGSDNLDRLATFLRER